MKKLLGEKAWKRVIHSGGRKYKFRVGASEGSGSEEGPGKQEAAVFGGIKNEAESLSSSKDNRSWSIGTAKKGKKIVARGLRISRSAKKTQNRARPKKKVPKTQGGKRVPEESGIAPEGSDSDRSGMSKRHQNL